MHSLDTTDYYALRGYVAGIENFFFGANFETTFDVQGFVVSGQGLSIPHFMLTAYPHSKPHEARVALSTVEEMTEEIERCFSLPDSTYADRLLANIIERRVRADYWQHLEKCIDYKQAAIWSYGSDVGLPGDYVFWAFAYIIYSQPQQRCVFIYGAASD